MRAVRRIVTFALALASRGSAAAPVAAADTDYPLARLPYSVQTPLIDMLSNARTSAILNGEMGDLIACLPSNFTSTTPPSFATIITARKLIGMGTVATRKMPLHSDAMLTRLKAGCRRHLLPAGVPSLRGRARRAHVLVTLDETSYSPVGYGARQYLRMGDHLLAWTRCVGNGRSFYSAIGHRPQSYTEPHSLALLEHDIALPVGLSETACRGGMEWRR